MNKPLVLSDRQMRLVRQSVPVSKRDEVMQKLAKHLSTTDAPSDYAVSAALTLVLNSLHVFMTDSKT